MAWLERKAGQHHSATKRFEAVAADYELLSDLARYWGAQSAFSSRDYKATVRLCLGISLASTFGPRSKYLRGRAQLRLREYKPAIETLKDFLARYPSASYARDVKLTLAVAYEKDAQWEEAAKLYQELRTRHPGRSVEKEALAGIKRIKSKLSQSARDTLLTMGPRDRVRRAGSPLQRAPV